MKRLVLMLCLLPGVSLAANGDPCRVTPPSTEETGSTVKNTAGSCVDLLDYTSINGAITGAGPFWLPLQNSPSTKFTIMGNSTNCAFDTLDVVLTKTSGSPADNWKEVLGTLDDDGTGGSCGGASCVALHVPYEIDGYIWITSNGATIGGASCTSFKLRMTQAAK